MGGVIEKQKGYLNKKYNTIIDCVLNLDKYNLRSLREINNTDLSTILPTYPLMKPLYVF